MVLRTGLNSIWSSLIDWKRPWKKCKTWLMKVASPVEIVPHSAAATSDAESSPSSLSLYPLFALSN